MITQVEIARRVGLDVSSVNKILNRRAGPVFHKDTIRKVFQISRELGYDFGRLKHTHRRRHERREVTIGVEVTLQTKDGNVFDQGVGTIRDLSQCGARLTDLATPLGTLPTEPFTILLKPMQKPIDDLEIRGHVVRLNASGQMSFGIDFGKVDPAVMRKLRRVTA